jgi:polyphosphate kinase
MQRNLSGRVEVVTPVWDPALKARLWEVLDTNLRDRRLAWLMKSDGSYELLQPADGGGPETVGTHEVLMDLARARASA